MKKTSYKDFSLKVHQKGAKKPIVCQIELTFSCPIDCTHCYASCYKKTQNSKLKTKNRELDTKEWKKILTKIRKAGCIWICFTGGDPLSRSDFLEIYDFAKKRGFIITIFTSGVPLSEKIAEALSKNPPFSIEITLNGITKKTYEKISQTKDSFKKAMEAIKLCQKYNLPLKIKTMVTKQNLHEIPKIEKFVKKQGLKFKPSTMIYPRLSGDLTPLKYRLSEKEILEIDKKYKSNSIREEEKEQIPKPVISKSPKNLFRCAGGFNTFYITPYGEMTFCTLFRKPGLNLLKYDVKDGFFEFAKIRALKYKSNSPCKNCQLWAICHKCPGKALLEVGDPEAPIPYYCRLAKIQSRDAAASPQPKKWVASASRRRRDRAHIFLGGASKPHKLL